MKSSKKSLRIAADVNILIFDVVLIAGVAADILLQGNHIQFAMLTNNTTKIGQFEKHRKREIIWKNFQFICFQNIIGEY
jgi:hypothetical protein